MSNNKIFEKIRDIDTSSTIAQFVKTLVQTLKLDFTKQQLIDGIGMFAETYDKYSKQ